VPLRATDGSSSPPSIAPASIVCSTQIGVMLSNTTHRATNVRHIRQVAARATPALQLNQLLMHQKIPAHFAGIYQPLHSLRQVAARATAAVQMQ
jgi:hypothetical protein